MKRLQTKLFLFLLHLSSCCYAFFISNERLTLPNKIHRPLDAATVTFENVYFQHESSWTRRLLSSEPRRTWALEDISFQWESELVLLVGASSSGKSTALQLMCHHHHQPSEEDSKSMAPTQGSIHVSSLPIYVEPGRLALTPGRNSWTVQERLAKRPSLLQAVALASSASKTASHLSLSDQYKLTLAELCVDTPDEAPILLLDEWLDKETTAIVSIVEAAFESFVAETKGIVCVVTHKPDRWKTQNRMELRSGKLIRRTRP